MMFRRFVASVIAVAPVVMSAACSDSSPSAPTAVKVAPRRETAFRGWGDAGYGQSGNHGTGQAALTWCENHGPATASANIGPAGGIITVGNARLILPPGALTTTVHVTATQPGGEDSKVSFQPAGLQFKKPAGLIFDVSGCDVSSYTPDIVYLNDEGVIVERIDAFYSSYWHQVAAPVRHFSTYALAW